MRNCNHTCDVFISTECRNSLQPPLFLTSVHANFEVSCRPKVAADRRQLQTIVSGPIGNPCANTSKHVSPSRSWLARAGHDHVPISGTKDCASTGGFQNSACGSASPDNPGSCPLPDDPARARPGREVALCRRCLHSHRSVQCHLFLRRLAVSRRATAGSSRWQSRHDDAGRCRHHRRLHLQRGDGRRTCR